METVLLLGIWLFIVTHLDTLVVISAFCADNHYQVWEVLVGHYVSFAIGLIAAIIGAIVAAEFLQEWTFLLGSIPLALGVSGLVDGGDAPDEHELPMAVDPTGRVFAVAAACVGLSGENLAVWIPFFGGLAPVQLGVVAAVYFFGAGVVYLVAYAVAQRYVDVALPAWIQNSLVPLVLIVIGGYVLVTGWLVA